MIITYEAGDVVEVDDDVNAGEFAAETVKLVGKAVNNGWYVESTMSNRTGIVDEIFLNP